MAITELWVEKYRPKNIDGYVFVDNNQRQQVESWLRDRSIPHLLFSGGPGTGKTTLAKMLINELAIDEYDVMWANGSKEARKVEWVDRLIAFCQTMPYGDFKVVLIDEADFMNPNSVQPALRNLMEDYSHTVRFIMTCNYPNKIIPPLHSRLQQLHIPRTDHTEFTARAATILVSESVEFDIDTLDGYVRATYPDLRKCIQLLQQNSTAGQLVAASSTDRAAGDWKLDCVQLFKAGRINEARKLMCASAVPEEVEDMFTWLYQNLDLWTQDPEKQDQGIIIIRNGMAAMPLVADQEINLSATLCELSRL
jgi:DNA polymerase III delta prime subunit